MRTSNFLFYLFITIVVNVLLLYPIHRSPRYSDYLDLSIFSIAFFSLYNLVIFFLSHIFQDRSNDARYISLIYLNFIIKLVTVIGIPVAYFYIKAGGAKNFVIPFLLIYVTFTIFETYYLNKNIRMRRS